MKRCLLLCLFVCLFVVCKIEREEKKFFKRLDLVVDCCFGFVVGKLMMNREDK